MAAVEPVGQLPMGSNATTAGIAVEVAAAIAAAHSQTTRCVTSPALTAVTALARTAKCARKATCTLSSSSPLPFLFHSSQELLLPMLWFRCKNYKAGNEKKNWVGLLPSNLDHPGTCPNKCTHLKHAPMEFLSPRILLAQHRETPHYP